MVEEVVESIQQLLRGESFDSFDRLSSDSTYLDPCLSIFENTDYSVQIRFNVCKIISILIQKFASTSWPVGMFTDLDSWFLSLIDKDNLPNTDLNDLSINSLLGKEIGRAYGCLLYSYKREDKDEFINFIPRLMEHTKSSNNSIISCFNFMVGICQFLADNNITNFLNTVEMCNIILHVLAETNSDSENPIDLLIIQSSLELVNSILLIYNFKYNLGNNYDEIQSFSIRNCPIEINNIFITSPLFMQNYLAEYFKKFTDSKLRILILDILFHIVSIHINDLLETGKVVLLYEYALKDLIEFIQIIFGMSYFNQDVWIYIEHICMISYKIQISLNHNYIKEIECYPEFISLFAEFCLKILFSFETEEVDTNSISYFFSNSQIFTTCLKFWSKKFENFMNFQMELRKIIFDSTTNILKNAVDFLFFAIHEDSESTFISLYERPNEFRFDFISWIIRISEKNVSFFSVYFNEMLEKYLTNYMNDRQSIENELDLSLALNICSQFMVIYSPVKTTLTNFDYMNFIDSDPDIPQTSPPLDFFELEFPIVTQILNLISESDSDDFIQAYIEFHQSTSSSTFLENSILNFIFNFKFMVYNSYNPVIKEKMQEKKTSVDKMLSVILSKICNDTKFFSVAKFDFYVDILFRIISILSNYADKMIKYSFISNQDNLRQLLEAGNYINEAKLRKRYYKHLFKVLFDQPFLLEVIEFYSNQFEQFAADFEKCLENQEEIQKFNNLLIDYSILFNSTSNKNNYTLVFDNIFMRYYLFFEEKTVQIFTNEQISPYAFSFWISLVTGTSKIAFPQYSPNGVILFKTTIKILSSFYETFNQYANDENIGNYLKCLKRSLIVYYQILNAKYFPFKILTVYHDNTLIDSINLILKSIMKFDLKNIFNYKKLGQILTNITITLLNIHTNVTFGLDDEILAFLFHVLEDSIFVPNIEMTLKDSYEAISNFVDFCGNNRTEEKITSLLTLLNDSFNRLFLEIWQSAFKEENIHLDDSVMLIRSFLSFYQCFPPEPREIILSAIPDDYKEEFDKCLEIISQEPDKLNNMIKEINLLSKKYFPFNLSLIDCFPINWNSSNK